MTKQTKKTKQTKHVDHKLTTFALVILGLGIIFAAEFTIFGYKEHTRVNDESNTLWATATKERDEKVAEGEKRMIEIKKEKEELNETIASLEKDKAAQNGKTAASKAEIERIDKELEMFGANLLNIEAEYAKLEKAEYNVDYTEPSHEGYICFYFAAVCSLIVSSFTALALSIASRGRDNLSH